MKFISTQIKSILFILLLFHHEIIEFRARASSFSAFTSLSNENHAFREKFSRHSSSRSKLSPSSVKYDICGTTRTRSKAVTEKSRPNIDDWIEEEPKTRQRSDAMDFTTLMGSELFCGDELLSIKRDAMNPKLRFYVQMDFSPFSSDKDLSMATLLANTPAYLDGDPNTKISDTVLEKISLPLEFGFTVIHQGGKKFEFEPILPFKELIDSLAQWVAHKVVYPNQKEKENEKKKTTLWQDMKKFYQDHKVQINEKLEQAGKKLIGAIGEAILRWLIKFVVGSVILAIFPYLAPLVLVYQIVNILLKFKKSKKYPMRMEPRLID